MSTEKSDIDDAPADVIDAIFGPSAGGGQEPQPGEAIGVVAQTAMPNAIVAQLDHQADGRRLTLICQTQGQDGEPAPIEMQVSDVAEADREINALVQRHPGCEVTRTGDGWLTHPE